MCHDDTKLELESRESDRTAQDLRHYLKDRHGPEKLASKRAVITRLHELNFMTCKSAQEWGSKAREIFTGMEDFKLTNNEIVSLRSTFSQYMMIVDRNACTNATLSDIDSFIKHIEDEEQRLINEEKSVNFITNSGPSASSRDGRGGPPSSSYHPGRVDSNQSSDGHFFCKCDIGMM